MTIEGIQLSPQQKHLWELMRADEGGAYQARCAVRVQGRLDKRALKNAIEQVVERHEILRTVFQNVSQASVPVQVIARIAPSLREIDLTRHAAQAQEVETLFQNLEQPPFASESPVLLILVELSETQHVLLISVAAACADSATLDNLVREISKSYDADLRGVTVSEAPLQYADISEVFNELLDSEETETGRSYWQQQDLSSLQRVRLPFENDVATTFETSSVAEEIAPDVFEKLDSLATETGTSPAIVLLTCWQILLQRLTAQTHVITGVNYDGRSYEGLAEALGLFARYTPVQRHVDDTQTFASLLLQVEKTAREVEEWQDYFSPRLSDLEFLPYCFEFENTRPLLAGADVGFAIVKRHTCFDRFRLKLRCSSIDAELQFDRSLCNSADAEVLLGQFNTLLISALDNPHRPIAELEIMSARERGRIIVDFNQTQVDYPQDVNLHQLFEAQVARTPDTIAVTFNETELSFATLNAKANQLAHHLQHLGVGPEARVGLYLERGPEQLITVLGILKAGGSYVPLDPASPPERLSFIINEARLSALVTKSTLASSV
ncbi:MAG: condensation domain-containing protein, partial [Gemmatimonadaceae bacterium]